MTAVDDVSLRVADGEFASIAGPSGCGKSTLLKVVAGLTETTSGEVRLRGNAVRGPQREIGYVFRRAATSCCRPRCGVCPARTPRPAATT